MAIVYAEFIVQIHGLDYDRMEQVEAIRKSIDAHVRSLHPDIRTVDDVEVELSTTAGEPVGADP